MRLRDLTQGDMFRFLRYGTETYTYYGHGAYGNQGAADCGPWHSRTNPQVIDPAYADALTESR